MHTNEVWRSTDVETRNIITDIMKKWRKLCRDRDTEFVRGSEHVIDMRLNRRPLGETVAGKFKDAVLDITDTFVQRTNCLVRVEVARRVAINLVQRGIASWDDIAQVTESEIDECFSDGPARALIKMWPTVKEKSTSS